tara:strand:- start:45 stop:443 length:399 start_codon:yes stop_codon:yes gene_type:complete
MSKDLLSAVHQVLSSDELEIQELVQRISSARYLDEGQKDQMIEILGKNLGEDWQQQQKDAWYRGDDHYALHKAANPKMHAKTPEKKKPSIKPPKDKQDRDRDAWYKKGEKDREQRDKIKRTRERLRKQEKGE